ncbi:hypothetical protein ACHQM5_025142 [Ranunculus cassubicifolius]
MVSLSKPSKPTIRYTSLYLEKILKTQQSLSKPPPKTLWKEHQQTPFELTLNHPILQILESSNGNLAEFNQIHTQLIISNLFQHSLTASRVIKKLCSYHHGIPLAVTLFSHLDEPDAFICNTIMRAYVNSNDHESGIMFYYKGMVRRCIVPNHYTFPLLGKMCGELGLSVEGKKMHGRSVKFGLEFDLFVRNSMISMYSLFGRIGDAQKVFDEMSELDLVSWNSMIDGYVKNGEVGSARKLFDEMPERDIVSWNSMIGGYVGIGDMETARMLFDRMYVKDVVSWNCMIDGYARIGNVCDARDLFDRMKERNVISWNTMLALYVRVKDNLECLRLFDRMMERGEVKPNEATLVSILTACANIGKLEKGKCIHSYIKCTTWIRPDVLLSTALLTMYAKCGEVDLAREVFNEMPERSVVSWNSMIMGYGMHGHCEKALDLFLEMEKCGEAPNGATFVCILSACAHARMVLEGWWYFDLMQRVYKIEPIVEHYGCMVDLLGRAGLMKDSEQFIEKVPIDAGPALWGALLSACKTHSNFELGEIIGKRLIELNQRDIGPYVLLSNIYAMEGKWDHVEEVRKLMEENGLQKSEGLSHIDISGSDGCEPFLESRHGPSHKKSMVYSMLTKMGAQIKLCRDGER